VENHKGHHGDKTGPFLLSSVRESTKQGNDKVARQMEAAHKTSLAKGKVGIREKRPVPARKEFCDTRLEPWAKATFEHTCKNNWFWFRAGYAD